jgi:hypothetical protein
MVLTRERLPAKTSERGLARLADAQQPSMQNGMIMMNEKMT